MTGNQTFTMIKPDAVSKNHTGAILKMFTDNGFTIAAMKLVRLTREQACAFYDVHRGKPFYDGLTEFMSSGPVVAACLLKDNAVADFRQLIGATDPAEAADGTVRKLFAESKSRNAVHGSDSDENAAIESDFFFSKIERVL
ncbi:MAG: nucleoside-diphosphate kinase [Bacteroidales bacterium]|jgi:nucleoside-diphosphate kinase|nr:nucleoside-diphosphate kinase [Bacteroidales bacterium]